MSLLHRYILLTTLLVVFSPVCALGAAPQTVGVVFSVDNSLNRTIYQSFTETLQTLDYGSDKLSIFIQKPHSDLFSWANSARRAEAAGADILVTFGSPMTRVALRETPGLPVIFAGVFTPLETPLEGQRMLTGKALQQAAGVYSEVPIATLLKAYSQIHGPGTVTAVFHQEDIDASFQFLQMQQAAGVYDLIVDRAFLDPAHLETSLCQLNDASDAFWVSNALLDDAQLELLLARLQELQRPVLGLGSGLAGKGALIALENSPAEQGAVAARQLVQVLEGRPISTLTCHTPHQVDLVLNLPAARAIDLQVPFNLLSSATQIIH